MLKLLFLYIVLFVLAGCSDKKSEKNTPLSSDYSGLIPGKVGQQLDEAFALTFVANDSIFLIGEYEPDRTVFLLNNEKGDIYRAKTGSQQVYYEKLLDIHWELTALKPQPKTETRLDLAFANENKINFKATPAIAITDSLFIANIHREIKLSGLIDTLLSYDDEFPSDSLVGIYKPKIAKMDCQVGEAYVVTYSYVDSLPGPRMVILNNCIFPLTGPCSYQQIYPFQINDRCFIQTGSTCCECGWVIDQVFEIKKDEVVLVFQDDSYSE